MFADQFAAHEAAWRPKVGAILRTTVVGGIGLISGVALAASDPFRVTGILIGATTAIFAPIALVAVCIAEYWPLVAISDTAGQLIVATSLLGSIGWLLSPAHRQRAIPAHRIRSGHLALLGIVIIALVDSLFVSDVRTELLYLTVLASLPLGLVGVYYGSRRIQLTWVIAVAALPLLLRIGAIDRDRINPITVGNLAWISVYFLVTARKQMPGVVWLPLAVLALAEWLATDELGPRIAGGVCFVVAAVKALTLGRSKAAARVRGRARSAALILLAAALLIGSLAVGNALTEAGAGVQNNTTTRWSLIVGALDSAKLAGGGIRDVTGEIQGHLVLGQPHNFVVDALSSAGFAGLLLLAFALWQAFRGAVTGRHPLIPYCVGVAVMNLFSGGLYRSPTLWFSLAFLIAVDRAPHAFSSLDAATAPARLASASPFDRPTVPVENDATTP